MAHFAKIENGIVQQVIVVSNEIFGQIDFPESEKIGQEFIAALGLDGTWKQTSYNGNFRGKYAAAGDIWTGKNFKLPENPELVAVLNSETPTE